MQETRNNCFGSKKRSTTLRQAETGKHECQSITATYRSEIFIRNSYCDFLASYGVIIQSVIQINLENASLWCFIIIYTLKKQD